jgi:DnaK suppressor protein
MVKKKKNDIKVFLQQLKKMRDEVEKSSEATEESRQPVELDQTAVGRLSRMDALQSQAMQLATERRRIIGIKRIDSALLRISDDEYGFCTSCGYEIEQKRLENDPTTPTCIDCAQLLEKK